MPIRSAAIVAWITLAVVAAQDAWAAGQRTHVEMGRRALEKFCSDADRMVPGFRELFSDRDLLASYYCGCMFPDWGFGKINDQAAEDAHWKRFQDAYYTYLMTECPYPWEAEERRRIAFFLGIVCHGMTDLPWHFSKEGHASLLQMSWGNDRADHSTTEASYDLFLYQDGTPPNELIPKVWWPMEDIREVYRRIGTILPPGQLETSFNRTHAMLNAGPVGARFTAGGLKRKYPWVRDHVEGYYFGGVDHGGALTATWLKYYYARMRGIHFLQNLPTAVAENNDDRLYAGCQDVTLIASLPKHNSGGEPILELSADESPDERRTLMRFDLTSARSLSSVSEAVLWLYVFSNDEPADGSARERELVVQPVPSSWIEGSGATDDVAGWQGQPHEDGSINWSSSQEWKWADTDSVPISASSEGEWVRLDVTKYVGRWLADPSKNLGVAIWEKSRPQGGGGLRAFSSEAFRCQRDGLGGGHRIALRPVLVLIP